MEMATTAPSPVATPTELKARVMAVRPRLPRDVRAQLIAAYPEYDTAQGGRKINNVLSGATSDARLTELLEKLAQPA